MKKFITLAIVIFFHGCSQEVPAPTTDKQDSCPPQTINNADQSNTEDKLPKSNSLTVTDWGPRSTKVKENPNMQPNGAIGLWLRLNTTEGLSKAALYVDETRAISTTVVDSNLVTAAISPKVIDAAGIKKVSLRNEETGVEVFSGIFEVSSN